MTSYLLLWDGGDTGYHPDEYRRDQASTRRGRRTHGSWSFGRRVNGGRRGDRVFLLRQHSARGIVASGYLRGNRGIYSAPHWDPAHGGFMKYVDVGWDAVVPVENRLPIDNLLAEIPSFRWNYVRASGHELGDPIDTQVDELWARHLASVGLGGAANQRSAVPISPSAAITPAGSAEAVSLETATAQTFEIAVSTSAHAVRRESQLVGRLQRELAAKDHEGRRYRVPLPDGRYLYTDIADLTDNVLWEAKGVSTREAVRSAIGQLLDYQRFIRPRPRLAVLLPELPEPDLQHLLRTVKIELWYETQEGFAVA